MSTYYEYQDVGAMMAQKLMSIEGWTVYGYHADESDSMTDYYSPAYWNGVAEKNGYILCVNVYGEAKPEEIRKYNHDSFTYDRSIAEKIQKLEQMTVERGASEAEAESAVKMIARLQKKAEETAENANKYIVTGVIPGHMANPPHCNWHIEKDGVIIAKGNGILKYSRIDSYYKYSQYEKDLKAFNAMNRKEYREKLINENMTRWNDTRERSETSADSHIEEMEKVAKLCKDFDLFINKLDTTCGGLLGSGDGYIYEKVTKTEYKTEQKAVETTNGSLKDGQCFILKSSFNYGRYKGLVYRIHEVGEEGKKYFTAYKLNGKLTKECHGAASQNNTWYIGTADNITKWIDKGAIAWCDIHEVKTPYEVEKVVKKKISNGTTEAKKETKTEETASADVDSLTFETTEDTDTRTNEKIYLVKVAEKLSREEYLKVNQYIKSIGGYYSKFKHAFLFKEDPRDILNGCETEPQTEETPTATAETVTESEATKTESKINYNITEDTHTQTGAKIWLVNFENQLSKSEFAEEKRKLATLKGYYSSFKKAFIFKYDPSEKLIVN